MATYAGTQDGLRIYVCPKTHVTRIQQSRGEKVR
jgi:hypothetical protein